MLLSIGSETVDEFNILQRIADRDEKALEALYDRYSRIVYSLVLAIVKQEEDAQDVIQELFLNIWEKASLFDPSKGSAYTWLITLARNRAIDRIRSRQHQSQQRIDRQIDIDTLFSLSDQSPIEGVISGERASLVKKAMAELQENERELITMAYFGGYSQSEISEKLNLPLGTVKTRMRQGMKKLYSTLIKEERT